MKQEYKGTRWYKCDLHLHTPASECFEDKTVTAEQWVDAAIENGLQCVAVTDHNTGAWIDNIKSAAQGKNLIVFPGVEITCDTSKIHLLIIFDTTADKQQIEDFLITCGIERNTFSKSSAYSNKTIIEIANIAHEAGAIIIPAHIDEYNGIAYCASRNILEEFLDLPFINAVQFVHQDFVTPELGIQGNDELIQKINAHYGYPPENIGVDNIKQAYAGLQLAIKKKKRLLTFSDNPSDIPSPKHGIFGIGRQYSWLKMGEQPTLESLRQALVIDDCAYNCFAKPLIPYKTPNLWIKRITIQNTTLTKKDNVLVIDFNPQLNAIIGGRGSGKSSILQFLRGVLNKKEDLEGLEEILQNFKDFFKKEDKGKGVLKENTLIDIYFIRNEIEYKISYSGNSNERIIERLNIENGVYEKVTDEGFIEFFQLEQYSQKQIFSIAQKPNSLRNRIDNAIPETSGIWERHNQLSKDYQSTNAEVQALNQAVSTKGRLTTEIKDLQGKIHLLQQSGIADLITQRQFLLKQQDIVDKYFEINKKIPSIILDTKGKLEALIPFEGLHIDESYRDNILELIQPIRNRIDSILALLEISQCELQEIIQQQYALIQTSPLYEKIKENDNAFNQKKQELEEKGVTDIVDFETYTKQLKLKEEELATIIGKEVTINQRKADITEILLEYIKNRKKLTEAREKFIESIIGTNKIRIIIHPFADKQDFENQFRNIIKKETRYDLGIEKAISLVYSRGDILTNLQNFKTKLHKIHNGIEQDEFDGHFTRLIQELSPNQMDLIDLLLPEDEIEMQYENRKGNYSSLAIASAGQKTTAILTFILSFGSTPLILDQPEDDLDNRLVYDLIVDRIRAIKDKRQIIIVTHNANIPVNGDAEYVISLASESRNLKIQAEGSIESTQVKNEICDVMEGGISAFKIRAARYNLPIKQ